MEIIGKIVYAKNGTYFIRCEIDGTLTDVFAHWTAIVSPHSFKQLFIGDQVKFVYDPANRNSKGVVAKSVECIYV